MNDNIRKLTGRNTFVNSVFSTPYASVPYNSEDVVKLREALGLSNEKDDTPTFAMLSLITTFQLTRSLLPDDITTYDSSDMTIHIPTTWDAKEMLDAVKDYSGTIDVLKRSQLAQDYFYADTAEEMLAIVAIAIILDSTL
ncbi:MAG: hypothetical protein RR382_00360 [Tannerellaceae bacterium]